MRSPKEQLRRRLGRFSVVSVRVRILAAVVALTVLALTVSGYTAFVLQQSQVISRIDDELTADAEEFRMLLEASEQPDSTEDFTSPADVVSTAMRRIFPTRNEGIVGFVDGEITYTSAVAPIALHEDQELVEALAALSTAERSTLETITTSTSTYRAVVLPVHAASTQPADAEPLDHEVAAFVMAYDVAAEQAVFAEGFIGYIGVAVFSLAVVAVVGWLVAGRLLYPVRVLAESARRIGSEDLSERIPVAGRDDLSEMTRAVNAMLERLEGAFEAQDQLVQDVSHELRTPLTILRGHLEVLDVGDADDIATTRELTLDELARMNRVIDDLTTLAQADHPEFLRLAETEVGTLTDEVYDKAVALGQRRWIISSRVEGYAQLDRQRVTQAWLQLAANAVKFSPPDSVIALGSQWRSGQLCLTVQDQGSGIAAADQDRVFERFQRADKAIPGSGLGLPIVDAITRAHGGMVELASSPGAGSTFSMILPTDSQGDIVR